MKVLHVINSFAPAGAEKLLLDTIPFYNHEGVQTDLLLLNGEESPFLEKLQSLQCCNIYTLSAGSVYNPILLFKIREYFEKYDLIHVHLFPAFYWVAFAKIFSFKKVKLIFTEHNTSNKRRGNFFLKIIERIIYSQYDNLVAISERVDFNLKKHLGPSFKNSLVIENGADLKQIHEAKPYLKNEFCSSDSVLLIQVSSFSEQKDQTTLIQAIAQLPFKSLLLLVGEGPLLDAAKILATQLGIEKQVCFLGLRMDVPQLLKTADIVVLSSKYEGLSLSSVEGLASGKPFIASDVPGLHEVVGGAGLLFPQGDVDTLTSHIVNLMSDSSFYDSVKTSCLQRSKSYDIQEMVKKHIDLYTSLVN
tara:strand:- start:463 stop:1545 length:1083 start_codon:yes stop_codon:yes gene_type:complete